MRALLRTLRSYWTMEYFYFTQDGSYYIDCYGSLWISTISGILFLKRRRPTVEDLECLLEDLQLYEQVFSTISERGRTSRPASVRRSIINYQSMSKVVSKQLQRAKAVN